MKVLALVSCFILFLVSTVLSNTPTNDDIKLELIVCHLIRGQPAYRIAGLSDQKTCLDSVVPFKDDTMLCARNMDNEVIYVEFYKLSRFWNGNHAYSSMFQ